MTDRDDPLLNIPADTVDALFAEGTDRAREENPLSEHITDRATGLFNAAYTALKLADEFKKSRRFRIPLSLVLLGLHPSSPSGQLSADDEADLINEIAGLLLCESRDIDHLARVEDHQLLMLLPHTPADGAAAMARRILTSVQERSSGEGPGGSTIEAWAGVAAFEGDGAEDGEDLMDRARESLSTSRRWGSGRVTVWQPAND